MAVGVPKPVGPRPPGVVLPPGTPINQRYTHPIGHPQPGTPGYNALLGLRNLLPGHAITTHLTTGGGHEVNQPAGGLVRPLGPHGAGPGVTGPTAITGPHELNQAAPAPHPGAPHPGGSKPAAPAPGPKNSATTSTPSSPLDATYFQNVAANQFKVNNQVNALNLQGSQAGTALQSALAQLAYQQPRAQLGLEEKANAGGGLYSSVYDQNLGNLNYGFLGKQGAAQHSYAGKMDSINSRIAGLQGSVPLYNASQAAAAAARQTRLAAANPGLGQGTGGLNTNPGASSPGKPGASTKPGSPTKPGTTPRESNSRAPKNRLARRIVEVNRPAGRGR